MNQALAQVGAGGVLAWAHLACRHWSWYGFLLGRHESSNRGDLENQCWEGVLIALQQIGPVWASSLLTPHVAFWAVGSSGYLARTHFRHYSLNGDI